MELAARVVESGEQDLLACWNRLASEPRRAPALGRPPSSDGRLRVLFFSAQSGWSGAEAALVATVGAMDKDLVAPSAFIPMDGLFADRMRKAGCRVDLFETNIASPTRENVGLLEGLLDLARPQLIHINSPGGAAVLAAAKPRGIPCVQHLRVTDMSRFADVQADLSARIAVSHYVQGLAHDGPAPHVIPDGIDTAHFSPGKIAREAARRALGLPERSPAFLSAARFDPQKRHDLLLEAFRAALDALPDALLLLAGDETGNPDWVRRLEERVSELGLGPAVRRFGFVEDIRTLYAAADAYAACGEGEAQGCALLEAMAMGLPPLAAAHGGQAELIEPGKSGLLFPAGDATALAAGLVSMRDAGLRRELGRAARRRAVELYPIEKAAERTLRLLLSIADRP